MMNNISRERQALGIDVPAGPGWWQATDLKWYPPQSHPARPAPTPSVHSGYVTPAPSAADGFAMARGLAARVSLTSGLLFGGTALAAVAIFLPFVTVSVSVLGFTLGAHQVSAPGAAKVTVLLMIAGAAWLAWPALFGSVITMPRRVGLTAMVALMVVLVLGWFVDLSETSGAAGGVADVSPGVGLLFYSAAVIALTVGVVRLWIQRPQPAGRPL